MRRSALLQSLLVSMAILFFSGTVKTEFSAFHATSAEKALIRVNDSLFAGKFELTNAEYKVFINDLKLSGQNNEWKKYDYDSTQWRSRFGYFQSWSYFRSYYYNEEFDNYPVLSVSFESALKYCEWLTGKYNSDPGRKYKKVIFCLPSEDEWKSIVNAFPGGKFPWYGELPYDQDGKFHANLKYHVYDSRAVSEYIIDGGIFPVKETWYKPNKRGFYNVMGNVAEMTNVKGKAKGGSWDTFSDEAAIDRTQDYSGPDPRVGFRVFMKVVEN